MSVNRAAMSRFRDQVHFGYAPIHLQDPLLCAFSGLLELQLQILIIIQLIRSF